MLAISEDKIDFKIHKVKSGTNPEYGQINVHIFVNDTPFYNGSILDVGAIFGCFKCRFSSFYLFNCSCGVPECAGFFEDIQCRVTRRHIYWNIPPSFSKSPKNLFVFNKKQYEEELDKLKKGLDSEFDQNMYLSCQASEQWGEYEDLKIDPKKELKASIEQFIKINKRQELFHDSLGVCAEIEPVSNALFKIEYEGYLFKKIQDAFFLSEDLTPAGSEESIRKENLKAIGLFLNGKPAELLKILEERSASWNLPSLSILDPDLQAYTKEKGSFDTKKLKAVILGNV